MPRLLFSEGADHAFGKALRFKTASDEMVSRGALPVIIHARCVLLTLRETPLKDHRQCCLSLVAPSLVPR